MQRHRLPDTELTALLDALRRHNRGARDYYAALYSDNAGRWHLRKMVGEPLASGKDVADVLRRGLAALDS